MNVLQVYDGGLRPFVMYLATRTAGAHGDFRVIRQLLDGHRIEAAGNRTRESKPMRHIRSQSVLGIEAKENVETPRPNR